MMLGSSFQLLAAPRQEPIQAIEPAEIKDPKLVQLGKKLFFEPRLSKSGNISCNSCHNLMLGGTDNQVSSIGHDWQLGPINSPTVFNSAYNLAQFWDGRAKDLQEQAGGPIANPGEMGFTHDLAVKTLKTIPGYVKEFKEVFGVKAININHVTKAIAAFEETLVTPNSAFDQWLKGDDNALTSMQKSGYKHFKEKGCIACHNGPAVGGTMFQKFGVVKDYATDQVGRYAVTKNVADKKVFKVPTLRNIERTYPYFHDGSVWSLKEAVNVMAEYQLGLKLSPKENQEIVAFLESLSGDLPKMAMPILPPSSAETPAYRRTDLTVSKK